MCIPVATRAKAATIPQTAAPAIDGTITAAAMNDTVITPPITLFLNEI